MKHNGKKILRTGEIVFDGLYEGLTATVRLNLSYGTKLDLSSGDTARWESAMREMVVDWNFTDDDGKKIPPGETHLVDEELLIELQHKWADVVAEGAKVPKA